MAGMSGLAASGVAGALRRAWLGMWPPPTRWPAAALLRRRRKRWQDLHHRYATLVVSCPASPEAEALARKRNQIALALPRRATWMGDRIASVEARVRAQYHIDLVAVWPRLWLVLPASTQAELRRVNQGLQDASMTAAWGVLYVMLGTVWWPGALAGMAVYAIGWFRGRVSGDVLAELIEAAVDVHGADVIVACGIPASDRTITPDSGRQLTRIARKGA
jgi:hypothetical protein